MKNKGKEPLKALKELKRRASRNNFAFFIYPLRALYQVAFKRITLSFSYRERPLCLEWFVKFY